MAYGRGSAARREGTYPAVSMASVVIKSLRKRSISLARPLASKYHMVRPFIRNVKYDIHLPTALVKVIFDGENPHFPVREPFAPPNRESAIESLHLCEPGVESLILSTRRIAFRFEEAHAGAEDGLRTVTDLAR